MNHPPAADPIVNLTPAVDSGPRLASGDAFSRRLRSSAVNVLGDGELGRLVLQRCDGYDSARQDLASNRTGGSVPIAVVGATGQGKSWLIRKFVHDPQAAAAIPSGNNADEATERLIWVGAAPPSDLDHRHESFVPCASDRMFGLGMPYLLVDVPGATDDRPAIAEIAGRALSLAGVLILVIRRDQLRSGKVGALARASEGAIVIPVVNAVRNHDDALAADLDTFLSRIRSTAPTSVISPVVLVDDFEVSGRSESAVAEQAIAEIATRIGEELRHSGGAASRRTARLAALDARFREGLCDLLSDRLPGLTAAVARLREAAEKLPGEIAQSLVGGGPPLRAAIRGRLRANLLSDTDSLWFPYRSLLGLLSLTSGAWDRVILSLAGSLPSLIGATWTGVRNVRNDFGAGELRDGLKRRAAAIVADRLGPLATRFRDEVLRLRGGSVTNPGPLGATPTNAVIGGSADHDTASRNAADLAGIDTLQEESQRIFDGELERIAVSRNVSLGGALLGTLLFWLLMSGPIIALYRGYLGASLTTLRELSGDLSLFPRPEAVTMLTGLMLSILPTALFAMAVISLAQRRRRVDQAEARITEAHRVTIARLQHERILRLRWDDPLLADAEFLLSLDNPRFTLDPTTSSFDKPSVSFESPHSPADSPMSADRPIKGRPPTDPARTPRAPAPAQETPS